MSGAYKSIVYDLERRGYLVLPDPEVDLPVDYSEHATTRITEALAKSETAIHLLGDSEGFRPDKAISNVGIVPLQLDWSASEKRRPDRNLARLIWAPRVLRLKVREEHDLSNEAIREVVREPISVFKRYQDVLDGDQIEGDTFRSFVQFIFDRLEGEQPKPSASRRRVYLRCQPEDRALRREAARVIRSAKCEPVMAPPDASGADFELLERRLLLEANQVMICWGRAPWSSVGAMLADDTMCKWRTLTGAAARTFLLICGPLDEDKQEILEFGTGSGRDEIIDATRPGIDLAGVLSTVTTTG